MSSPNREPMLPKVEESDLLGLVVEEVIDPAHKGWWEEFAAENPILARQILKRAYYDTQDSDRASSFEVQRRIIDNVSFAIRALKLAAERQQLLKEAAEHKLPLPESDGSAA